MLPGDNEAVETTPLLRSVNNNASFVASRYEIAKHEQSGKYIFKFILI